MAHRPSGAPSCGLPSGRYVKLRVGDSIDGGKVAAIGDKELRYVKRGRSVTLKMPRG